MYAKNLLKVDFCSECRIFIPYMDPMCKLILTISYPPYSNIALKTPPFVDVLLEKGGFPLLCWITGAYVINICIN